MTFADFSVFVQAVQDMRDAQRQFFKARTVNNLREAKVLEATVDRLLRELTMPSLFDLEREDA